MQNIKLKNFSRIGIRYVEALVTWTPKMSWYNKPDVCLSLNLFSEIHNTVKYLSVSHAYRWNLLHGTTRKIRFEFPAILRYWLASTHVSLFDWDFLFTLVQPILHARTTQNTPLNIFVCSMLEGRHVKWTQLCCL